MKKKMRRRFFSLFGTVVLSSTILISVLSCNQGKGEMATGTLAPESVFKQQAMNRVAYAGINAAGQVDFTEAAERSVNGVVHIKSTVVRQSNQQQMIIDPFEFFFGQPRRQLPSQPQPIIGFGSGVIISEDGYIITNNHVVENANEIEVTLNDNRTFQAKLVGRDTDTDIALLKIDAVDLPTLPFGDSDALKVGEWVLAVGNPFNLTSTVTAGIVSAKGRGNMFRRSGGDMKIESFIQTDAAVNPGNSGGALVNIRGELVGINTAIYSETGNYAGYSFAVPVSIAAKVAADLKQYGTVQRAILGVTIIDVNSELVKEKKLSVISGVYVNDFAERSSAKEAGVEQGDVITAVNDVKVKSAGELQEQISRYHPGDKVALKIMRGDKEKQITVELKNKQGSTSLVKDVSKEILGASFQELSSEKKRLYEINYGVEVTGVTTGKFKSAGITKGFILTSINGKSITTSNEVEQIIEQVLQNTAEDKALLIKGFYPNGKARYYAIDLMD